MFAAAKAAADGRQISINNLLSGRRANASQKNNREGPGWDDDCTAAARRDHQHLFPDTRKDTGVFHKRMDDRSTTDPFGLLRMHRGNNRHKGHALYSQERRCPSRLKTAGKIAHPFELKIVDNQRRILPVGEIGEIAVRGSFLMKGYYNKPEETAKVIDPDGWYYTTDLAFQDESGYIHITGRLSEMFKSGGENVYPREVEEVIETHGSVLFAAVLGVPDEIYQELGWAFVMPTPGKNVTEEELLNLCKSALANFKVPKKFFIRPLLPLLASGKVNKMALKDEIREMMKK